MPKKEGRAFVEGKKKAFADPEPKSAIIKKARKQSSQYGGTSQRSSIKENRVIKCCSPSEKPLAKKKKSQNDFVMTTREKKSRRAAHQREYRKGKGVIDPPGECVLLAEKYSRHPGGLRTGEGTMGKE